MAGEEAPAEEPALPAETAGLFDDSEPVEDLPDWLTAVAGDEAAGQSSVDPQVEPAPPPSTGWDQAQDEQQIVDQAVSSEQEAADSTPFLFDWQSDESAAARSGEPPTLQVEEDITSTKESTEESVMVPSDDELGTPDGMEDIESLLSDPDDALAWLEQLAADQGAPLEELPSFQDKEEVRAAPADDIPDWLKETAEEPLVADPELAELPTMIVEEPGDVPAWLRELDQQPAELPPSLVSDLTPSAAPREPALAADAPDWLIGKLGAGEAVELDEELAAMGADISEMPTEPDEAIAWLEQLAAQQGAPSEELASMEKEKSLEEPELPAWLTEQPEKAISEVESDMMAPQLPLPQAEVEPAFPDVELEPVASLDEMGEMPEDVGEAMAWLEQLAAQQGAPAEELPSVSAVDSSEPEMPSWLEEELPSGELETAWLSEEPISPAWLQELEMEPAAALEEPDLPEWLREPPAPVEPVVEEAAPESAVSLEEPDLPEWLREPAAPVEPLVEEPAPEPAVSLEELDLPEWLREPAAPVEPLVEEPAPEPAVSLEEFDLPEWLREPAAPVEPLVAEPAPEPAVALEEPDLPEWLREPAAALEEPVVEEPEPAVSLEEPDLPEWLREPPAPVEPVVEEAMPPAPEPAAAVVEEEEPVVDLVEMDIAPEPIEPEVLEPVTGIAAFRQQLAVEPDDHVTRLALARTLLDDDMLDKALAEYGELVAAGQELDDTTSDLERVVVSDLENTLAHRVLGDAYMKQNRLDKALEAYRQALGHLS